jgi:hypothetical protein
MSVTWEDLCNLGLSDNAINCLLYGLYARTRKEEYADAIWYPWDAMEDDFAFTVPQMIKEYQKTVHKYYNTYRSDLEDLYEDLLQGGANIVDGVIRPCSLTDSIERFWDESEALPEMIEDFNNVEFSETLVKKINENCASDSLYINGFLYDFLKENIK